ncbi:MULTISPECIES: YezD family protein [Bacillus]|nr:MULTISPECIES: YezD family protein [Bacillus]QHZ46739.1 YezD family protein [Bacillus sp. NSP9.1]WFA06871.1 YezD family protein [Bacillus sp. HSf4]
MKTDEQLEKAIIKMKDMLKDMNYGSITFVVQDGKVIQIEKNEKIRLK